MSLARPPRPGDERRDRFFRVAKRYRLWTLLAQGKRPGTTRKMRPGLPAAGVVVEHEPTGAWLRVFGPVVMRISTRKRRRRPE